MAINVVVMTARVTTKAARATVAGGRGYKDDGSNGGDGDTKRRQRQ